VCPEHRLRPEHRLLHRQHCCTCLLASPVTLEASSQRHRALQQHHNCWKQHRCRLQ
jgi:hypothetical protein